MSVAALPEPDKQVLAAKVQQRQEADRKAAETAERSATRVAGGLGKVAWWGTGVLTSWLFAVLFPKPKVGMGRGLLDGRPCARGWARDRGTTPQLIRTHSPALAGQQPAGALWVPPDSCSARPTVRPLLVVHRLRACASGWSLWFGLQPSSGWGCFVACRPTACSCHHCLRAPLLVAFVRGRRFPRS